MIENLDSNICRQRIKDLFANEEPYEAIALVEDELDDLVCNIFKESKEDLDKAMEGNAMILYKKNGGIVILTDEGEKVFMYDYAYKGSSKEKGTRIQCGKFKMTKRGRICIDAQECLSLNELKYKMFMYIDEQDMIKASSAAWAIYKDASPENRDRMKFCIHSLRNYMKRTRLDIAC